MLGARQLPFVLAGVGLMTLQPVLVKLSQNGSGRTDYSPAAATLMSELLKAAISVTMLRHEAFAATEKGGKPLPLDATKRHALDAAKFAVPALVYFVNNNLVFYILERLSATTFQLVSQLKTVITGLLFRLVLGKRLSHLQYTALWQLTCGTATSQIPVCLDAFASAGGDPWDELFGLGLAFTSCVLSSIGGIYAEKLLKDRSGDSIHWQNLLLYGWGVLFNLAGVFLGDGRPVPSGSSLFFSWIRNPWAVAVVVNNALNGLAISAILKYADNIARVYAHAISMVLTMLLSVGLFGDRPTPQLLIAVGIVAGSTLQYNMRPEHATVGPVAARWAAAAVAPPPAPVGRGAARV